MEYTQWVINLKELLLYPRLNPCCNGIYSMRAMIVTAVAAIES